jgi:hypothetical protein
LREKMGFKGAGVMGKVFEALREFSGERHIRNIDTCDLTKTNTP